PLLAMAFLIWRVSWTVRPRQMIGLLLAATLFFTLGAALLIVPLDWWPHDTMVLAIGLDLELLGVAITMLDAFDEGETLRADIVRSFVAAGGTALLFGLQVALAIVLGTGVTFPMVALLMVVVATSIAAQTFAEPIQAALDRLAFAGTPRLRRERADLRA